MMLTRETWKGPWAGLPVAWDAQDRFDEAAYRADVRRCCEAGIPGVYTGGTTGEFYAIEIDEFREISRATVEECHSHGAPAMIGCSATSTKGATRRARIAAELGADAIQVTLPFWMEVGDRDIVPFFKAVSDASGGLPLSVYETKRCKRVLTVEEHRMVREAVPSYLMVKSNAGTIGATKEGCQELSEFVNVFAAEIFWKDLADCGIAGACSAMVYWNPTYVLGLWNQVRESNSEALVAAHRDIIRLHEFFAAEFGPRGFTDTAYDRLLGNALGILQTSYRSRGPYPSPTGEDARVVQTWCHENFPEFLRNL